MTKEERIKRRKKRKRFRVGLIVIVFVYLIFRLVPTLYASNTKTHTVEIGTIELSHTTQGIVVKDEEVYKTDGKGAISFLKNEGDKVGIGFKIAKVNMGSNLDNLNKQLNDLDNKINELSKSNSLNNIFADDAKKNQEVIDDLTAQIQDNIINKNFDVVDRLKDELNKRLERQKLLTGEKTYSSATIESLKEQKKDISMSIENASVYYTSQKTGILSFDVDGLEEVYSVGRISELKPKDFKIAKDNKKTDSNIDNLKPGDPMFKIIDGYQWFIIIKLDKKDSIDSFEEGKYVYIHFKDKDLSLRGQVSQINKEGNEAIVIFRFNSHLHELYNLRYAEIDVIHRRYEGLKIPNKAIVEQNGLVGVYIKDVSGIVRFRPIKVIGTDGEYSIVDEGDGYRNIIVNIDGQEQSRRTLRIFDEIFINATKLREGQIVN